MSIQYVTDNVKVETNQFGAFLFVQRLNRPARTCRGKGLWRYVLSAPTVEAALNAYYAQ